MVECATCKYAVWDYEDYHPYLGTHPLGLQWFISCCKLGNNEEDCEDFEEEEDGKK